MMWPFTVKTIDGEIKSRRITRLLHSTHLYVNLPRILEMGWIQTAGELRRELGFEKAGRYLHDAQRYEQFAIGLDFLNCSISVPNYELLYHRSKANWKAEWVHLALNITLLSRDSTRFCAVSAAKKFGEHVGAGHPSFRELFAEHVDRWNRIGLEKHEPTHPQAEVLVAGSQRVEMVTSIIVPSEEVRLEVSRLCERHSRAISVDVAPQFFVWPKRLVKH